MPLVQTIGPRSRLLFVLATCIVVATAYQNSPRLSSTQRFSRMPRYPSSGRYSTLISQRPLLHPVRGQLFNRVSSHSSHSFPGNRPFVGNYAKIQTFSPGVSKPSRDSSRPFNHFSHQNKQAMAPPLTQFKGVLPSSLVSSATNLKTEDETSADYSDQETVEKADTHATDIPEPREVSRTNSTALFFV